MAEMRTPIVTFLCFLLLETIYASSVHITQEWKPDFGWEVTCHWALDMDDRLQSVMLARNKQQFFMFRPEDLKGALRKTEEYVLPESHLAVDCIAAVEKGIKGRCVFTVEPKEAPNNDFTFSCYVSGERPYFKVAEDEITIEALVPPSRADMIVTRPESGPVTINCTSSGIPSPKIIWTVNNQTVPHNFYNSVWNETSKLWDAWSTFAPPYDAKKVMCRPEVEKGSHHIQGQPVEYNSSFRPIFDILILTIALLSTLI